MLARCCCIQTRVHVCVCLYMYVSVSVCVPVSSVHVCVCVCLCPSPPDCHSQSCSPALQTTAPLQVYGLGTCVYEYGILDFVGWDSVSSTGGLCWIPSILVFTILVCTCVRV